MLCLRESEGQDAGVCVCGRGSGQLMGCAATPRHRVQRQVTSELVSSAMTAAGWHQCPPHTHTRTCHHLQHRLRSALGVLLHHRKCVFYRKCVHC